MPEYRYQARDFAGKIVSGQVAAADQQEAMQQLTDRKLFPTTLLPAAPSGIPGLRGGKKIGSGQLVNFYSQLSDLLVSGVPLLRALRLIEDQAEAAQFRVVVADIREQVADGKRLAQAFARHPESFSSMVISLVEAGEEGSFLEDALRRLAMFVQHQNELKGRVVGAMIYPVFVAGFSLIIAVVMLVFFVPKFQAIFDRMAAERGLPWATTTLMAISQILQQYWVGLLIGLVLIVWGLVKGIGSPGGRLLLDRLLIGEYRIGSWRLGLAGITRSLAIARFCRVLGTMLHNGVPMLRSLAISRKACGNQVLELAIEQASGFVSSGKSLAGPLRQSGYFPSDVMEMIAVAEESNQLERVLVEISDQLERKVQARLDIMVRLLEPIMLLSLAGFVLFILIALLLPILQSSNLV